MNFRIGGIVRFLIILLFTFFITSGPSVWAADGKLPFKVPADLSKLAATALLETTKGPIEIEFFREEAPVTVANFQYLAKKGFYDRLKFHRYVEDYIVQGGDPQGNGKGGSGYRLYPEFSQIKHGLGTVGMARKPDPVNPQRLSNGSQFYITLGEAKHLNGLYSVFARVINGYDNLKRLREEDQIIKILLPVR